MMADRKSNRGQGDQQKEIKRCFRLVTYPRRDWVQSENQPPSSEDPV